jgi:pathogenesis-related protein 1
MRPFIALFAVFLLALGEGCGGVISPGNTDTPDPPGDPPDTLVDALLEAHNTVREDADPAPSPPLPPFVWSERAASAAQTWANGCVWSHNSQLRELGLGENIAAFAPPGADTVAGRVEGARKVVEMWAGEAAYYTYSTDACADGKTCGHYTQIVWRATTAVGCGYRICTQSSPFGQSPWEFWVCDYEPPGNLNGQKPY